eukprot:g11220.t1
MRYRGGGGEKEEDEEKETDVEKEARRQELFQIEAHLGKGSKFFICHTESVSSEELFLQRGEGEKIQEFDSDIFQSVGDCRNFKCWLETNLLRYIVTGMASRGVWRKPQSKQSARARGRNKRARLREDREATEASRQDVNSDNAEEADVKLAFVDDDGERVVMEPLTLPSDAKLQHAWTNGH